MSFDKTMKESKENDWSIDVKTVEGRKHRGKLKWWGNYTLCLGFSNGDERIFFKANLIYVSPVKE